jgi:hypothetical protein
MDLPNKRPDTVPDRAARRRRRNRQHRVQSQVRYPRLSEPPDYPYKAWRYLTIYEMFLTRFQILFDIILVPGRLKDDLDQIEIFEEKYNMTTKDMITDFMLGKLRVTRDIAEWFDCYMECIRIYQDYVVTGLFDRLYNNPEEITRFIAPVDFELHPNWRRKMIRVHVPNIHTTVYTLPVEGTDCLDSEMPGDDWRRVVAVRTWYTDKRPSDAEEVDASVYGVEMAAERKAPEVSRDDELSDPYEGRILEPVPELLEVLERGASEIIWSGIPNMEGDSKFKLDWLISNGLYLRDQVAPLVESHGQ